MYYIFPYNKGSKSAKSLRDGLNGRMIKREGSRFRGSRDKTVINWGCSELPPPVMVCSVLNKPEAVATASNKLTFFNAMRETGSIPAFSNRKEDAVSWIKKGHTIVCRTVLQGHSGVGIVIAQQEADLVDAPLYVKYIKKNEEYRVHVMKGEAFDVQRKARRRDVPDDEVNWQVRNHDNGFIYQRNDIRIPNEIKEVAVEAINKVELDFGAVDILWNERNNRPYVLEINTAPGLIGTTLSNYITALREIG